MGKHKKIRDLFFRKIENFEKCPDLAFPYGEDSTNRGTFFAQNPDNFKMHVFHQNAQ